MGEQHSNTRHSQQSCKLEGNLTEYPLFFFERTQRKTKESYVFEEKQTDGRVVRRTFTVLNGAGLPGALAQDCLVALMVVRESVGKRDVQFYIIQIATLLFGKHRAKSMRIRQLVKKNLELLATTMVKFEDAFLDKEKGDYITTKILPLFHGAQLYEHRPDKNRREAWKENVFRLGDLFEKNLGAKYFNRILLDTYKKLPSGLPRRLFLYLTKKSNGGRARQWPPEGSANLEKLYNRLPITAKRASDRFETFKRAVDGLKTVGISYKFNNQGGIQFFFPPKFTKSVEAPAAAATGVDELVKRFYREALGDEQVSDVRLKKGREVLAAIQKEGGFGPDRMGKIVDWVLAQRGRKYKKPIYSIAFLLEVWGDAATAIGKEEKTKAAAEAKAREDLEVARDRKEREEEQKRFYADRIAKLSPAERADLRREAEQRAAQDRKYFFAADTIARTKDETKRAEKREQFLVMIERDILQERAEARP